MEPDEIRDRIVEIREMRLGDVAHNPRNPRTHPIEQKEAIEATVGEIGWAGVPLVYHSERTGQLTFVDGHARKEIAPDLVARVAILDLTDEEADALLLFYDPLAEMAGIAHETLVELTGSFEAENSLLSSLVDGMRDNSMLELEMLGKRPDFSSLIEQFSETEKGKAAGDEKWFYIEFYGDDERWAEIINLVAPYMVGNTKHELDRDFFLNAVKGFLDAKSADS